MRCFFPYWNNKWVFSNWEHPQRIETSWGNVSIQEKTILLTRKTIALCLSHVSEIFETIVYEQINSCATPRFSHWLCGFRKNHNTQHFLLKMLEKWKLVLDKGCKTGVIFMDLSKAFDTLHHKTTFSEVKCLWIFWKWYLLILRITCLFAMLELLGATPSKS